MSLVGIIYWELAIALEAIIDAFAGQETTEKDD